MNDAANPFPSPGRLRTRGGRLLLCALAWAMAGCAGLRTPVLDPAPDIPAHWRQGTPAGSAAAPAPAPSPEWWRSFGDARLDTVIGAALARNPDLAIATLRLRQARLRARLAGTDLWPAPGASLQASRRWGLDGQARRDAGELNATVAYELDLWGRLAQLRSAAEWEAQASQADHEAAAIALVATTATLYWRAGLLNERITLSVLSLADARATLELVAARHRAGAAAGLDLAQARQQLADLQAEHTLLEQARTENRHAFAILFDRPPGQAAAEPERLSSAPPPAVEAGLPASLLGRRPDLRQGEARLRRALAEADAVRAGFYPRLTLTGVLGSASADLGSLLRDPTALLGAGVELPFLRWYRIEPAIGVAQAEYEEAVVRYRKTLYTAFAEVEDALAARAQLATRGTRLDQALRAAEQAETLSGVRYRAGATALQPWLDAKHKRRLAQAALAQTRFDRLVATMALYKALGGPAELAAR